MNLFNEIDGTEQIRFTRTWSAATNIHSSNSTRTAKDDRAAGQRLIILGMPNLDASYIRDGVIQFHFYYVSGRINSYKALRQSCQFPCEG